MNLKVVEKLQLGKLVTPLPDRRRPVYNWFQMKEAFSRNLVGLLAETWGLGGEDQMLDPFCGVGTAPLACKELGLDCVGYDVHPVLLLASRVKLRDYNVEVLRGAVQELVRSKFERPEVNVPGFAARVFPKPTLADVTHFRGKIMEVEDEAVREFLLFGLAVAAVRSSWARKDGAAIRVVKHPVPPLRKALERQLLRMCKDLERFTSKPARVKVESCDVRKLKLEDGSVDAIITSPPYLRKQEYVHAYRIEQWVMGLDGPSADKLVGVRDEGDGEEDFSEVVELVGGKPFEVKLYFKDMFAAIKELYRVCKRGAITCVVTSDGCFRDGVVGVCHPLSELAEKVGFKTKRMIVVNRRYCTTPARKKVGVTRECLLLWEK